MLTRRLGDNGFVVLDGPRRTGDGYYESVVLDPDGNRTYQGLTSETAVRYIIRRGDPRGSGPDGHRADSSPHEAEAEDHQCAQRQEGSRLHVRRNGEAEQQGDQIREYLLRGVRKGTEHAALTNQVAKH